MNIGNDKDQQNCLICWSAVVEKQPKGLSFCGQVSGRPSVLLGPQTKERWHSHCRKSNRDHHIFEHQDDVITQVQMHKEKIQIENSKRS